MTTLAPTTSSPIRLLFWRLAARLTELALRHRLGMLAAWPYVQLAGGAMTAYLLGRLVGAWAMNAVP
jgi:hypothetical protein